MVEEALWRARDGVPGPVFVECPVDLLYAESTVRELYGSMAGKKGKSLASRAASWYLKRHVDGLFRGQDRRPAPLEGKTPEALEPDGRAVRRAVRSAKEFPL